jgi:hypothetical protein
MEISKKRLRFILMMIFTVFIIYMCANLISDNVFAEGLVDIQITDGKFTMGGLESKDRTTFFNNVLKEMRTVVLFISGIGTLLMVAFFIINFINLGKSQGNPQERQKAVSGLIMTGLATAGLGSVFLITSLFYGMLNNV